jgi:hypothetical protein
MRRRDKSKKLCLVIPQGFEFSFPDYLFSALRFTTALPLLSIAGSDWNIAVPNNVGTAI